MKKLVFHFSSGEERDIIELHSVLQSLGYTIAESELEDRTFGKSTEDAIKSFQKRNGLRVSGKVDRDTIFSINESLLKSDS